MLSASYGVKFQNFITSTFALENIENIQVLGLPLAFSLSSIFQFILFMFLLYQKIGDYKLKEIGSSALKIILGSLFMAGGIYLTLSLIFPIFSIQTFSGALWQVVIASLTGVLVYFITTLFLGSPEIKTLKSSILRQFSKI